MNETKIRFEKLLEMTSLIGTDHFKAESTTISLKEALGQTINIFQLITDQYDIEIDYSTVPGALAKSRRKSGVTDAFSGPVASVSLALLALKHNLFL